MSRMPRSAAWASRKRKSIDWDFSALRAMVVVVGGGEFGGLPVGVVVPFGEVLLVWLSSL